MACISTNADSEQPYGAFALSNPMIDKIKEILLSPNIAIREQEHF